MSNDGFREKILAPGDRFMSARKLLRNPHGQSIIEITLITPLLLAALYVAMDFGILFLTAHYTQNAAREASRIGAIMPDCAIDATVPCVTTVTQSCSAATATVVQEACNRLPQALTGTSVTVTLTGLYYPATCLREVKVTASGTYNYGLYRAMALMGFPVSATTPVARSADARYQGQPVTVTGTCS
jgi:Flp pilus assembly protein TadG